MIITSTIQSFYMLSLFSHRKYVCSDFSHVVAVVVVAAAKAANEMSIYLYDEQMGLPMFIYAALPSRSPFFLSLTHSRNVMNTTRKGSKNTQNKSNYRGHTKLIDRNVGVYSSSRAIFSRLYQHRHFSGVHKTIVFNTIVIRKIYERHIE